MKKVLFVITSLFLVSIFACSPPSEKLLYNANFEEWTQGPNLRPIAWGNLYGKVNRESDIVKVETFSIKLTSPATLWGYIEQDIYLTRGINAYKGKVLKFSCWVKCSKKDTARIQISDGSTSWSSPWHSGSGKWEELVISGKITKNATKILATLQISPGSEIAYFDEAALLEVE